MRLSCLLSICVFIGSVICVCRASAQQLDEKGSGRALLFDGTSDYIDLGNVYDDLVLPVTVSVWVKITPGAAYAFPIFNSQDNLPLYNGVTFIVSSSAFSIQYGDGMGENDPSYRRGKSAAIPDMSAHWINLTGVMRGPDDIDLYLNGINMGGNYGGDSSLPMSSMSPADVAKIGYWYSNGITTYFNGYMDELRIFDRSLSEDEIRQQMCKRLSGNESGLIGYWTFDEIDGTVVKDKSKNHFDGTIKGNPTRVYSGAPIGDESTLLYTTSWTGKSLSLGDIEVNNIVGNPEGIHIYKVNTSPSQINGLDDSFPHSPYYGIYAAGLGTDNFFDLQSTTENNCRFFSRMDNSQPQWSVLHSSAAIKNRNEVILFGDEKIELDLGPDKIFCEQTAFELDTKIMDTAGKSILWSNGATTPSIVVTKTGSYIVGVSTSCNIAKDTVSIQFATPPATFTLGEDDTVCTVKPRVLKPYTDSAGLQFEWQDGSTKESFEVGDFGIYFVTASNGCGMASDTLAIVKQNLNLNELPNIITPNEDTKNEFLVLRMEGTTSRLTIYNRWGEEVYNNNDYNDTWDGDELSSGVYFYLLTGSCGNRKGTVTISR